jgi:hypothetical protein
MVVLLVFSWPTRSLERYVLLPWSLSVSTKPRHALSYLSSQVSLGEMIAFLPLPGGFIKLAERFIDPAFAFAIGWNYWYGCTVRLVHRQI